MLAAEVRKRCEQKEQKRSMNTPEWTLKFKTGGLPNGRAMGLGASIQCFQGDNVRKSWLLLFFLLCGLVFCLEPQTRGQNEVAAEKGQTAHYPENQAGVLMQGAQWMGKEWTSLANQNPVKMKTARGFAASMSYGLVSAKVVAEFAGEQAPTRPGSAQPVICICHIVSLPGDPVLVRLHPKKGVRELDGGRMIVRPIVGGSKMADANASDIIPVDLSHPEPQVWLIRPQLPLEAGEYALMLGTQNMSIFPFSVRVPPASVDGTK
ncbi:MAG: hypothetical protein P4K83_09630 [Terracidiphilus sp.]|nr:hypothetical protein [Terracidiphilus sp.]